jgi:hypothetical protein
MIGSFSLRFKLNEPPDQWREILCDGMLNLVHCWTVAEIHACS